MIVDATRTPERVERPSRRIVTQGARSTVPAWRRPTPDDWLRRGERAGRVWERLV
jgi:hypothetical protein